MDQLGFDFFDNPSGASTASLLASNPNKTGINT
jgi:hypothetical protein